MAGRTTAVRAAAERRARDIRAQREAERKRREAQIDAALADFFEASTRAEQIKSDAAQRAAALLDRAEKEAAGLWRDSSRAIRALRDLGQTNAEIAEATGLSVGAVRTAAAHVDGGAAAASPGTSAGGRTGSVAISPAEAAAGIRSTAASNAAPAYAGFGLNETS